jgi:hypothetical protein
LAEPPAEAITEKRMAKIKTTCLAATLALSTSFAQQPDPESEFQRKLDAMQSECQRIAVAVPCAVGIAEVDKLPAATSKAERDALVKLAVSVQAFVSFHAKDSSYIEGRMSRELSSTVSKINVENMLVANSQIIKQDYVKLSDKDGEYYRAIVLRAFGGDKSLYEEAKKESEAVAVADTAAVSKTSAVSHFPAPAKTKLKQVASKAATILLGIAKRAIGVP